MNRFNRIVSVGLIVSAVLLRMPLFAQNPADAILDAAIEAHGKVALDRVQTVIVSGHIREGRRTESFTITASIDGYSRLDYGSGRRIVTTPGRRFEIVNGKYSGRPRHDGVFAQLDILGALGIGQLRAPAARRTLMAPTAVQGRAAYRIHVETDREITIARTKIRDVADVYIDTQTNLVSGLTRQQYTNRIEVKFLNAYLFTDHRSVEGLLFPFRIERYIDGSLQQVITVEQVQLNASLTPGLFQP